MRWQRLFALSQAYRALPAVLCVACSNSSGPDLDQHSFLLDSTQGFVALAGTSVWLSFRDDQVSFNAGCNSFGGTFEVKGDQLMVGALGSTQIACQQAQQAQDAWLAQFFSANPRVALNAGVLTLATDYATLVFLDSDSANPDRPLAGTHWAVDTFISGDSAGNLALPSDPTILFSSDGSLKLQGPCNSGTARYTVSADQIVLANVVHTLSFCDGAPGQADNHFYAVMANGILSYKIEGARLTLRRDALGLSAKAQ